MTLSVYLSGVLHLLFCSIVFFVLVFSFFTLPLPLPVRDEVMQRGEQLFIPSPSSNIRVMIRLEKTRKTITQHHHHLEVKTPSSLIIIIIHNILFLLRNMSIVRALYLSTHLIGKTSFLLSILFLLTLYFRGRRGLQHTGAELQESVYIW